MRFAVLTATSSPVPVRQHSLRRSRSHRNRLRPLFPRSRFRRSANVAPCTIPKISCRSFCTSSVRRLLPCMPGPPQGHLQTAGRIIMVTRPRRALVQHHCDIAPERRLNFHRDLGRNEGRRPIEMILKMDALVRDLAQLREREDLVTAAIGQDRPIPVHEAMQVRRNAESPPVPGLTKRW